MEFTTKFMIKELKYIVIHSKKRLMWL